MSVPRPVVLSFLCPFLLSLHSLIPLVKFRCVVCSFFFAFQEMCARLCLFVGTEYEYEGCDLFQAFISGRNLGEAFLRF